MKRACHGNGVFKLRGSPAVPVAVAVPFVGEPLLWVCLGTLV